MTMRATWTDEFGDNIELADTNCEGCDGPEPRLYLNDGGSTHFCFDEDDAESFAAYLRAWALKQREGK